MVDPCASVRSTSCWVADKAKHVSISSEALETLAEKMASETMVNPPAWDECEWHYHHDAKEGGPLTAQYIMVLDALNFCFWPSTTGVEYDTLATGLKKALLEDPHAFDVNRLKLVTSDTIGTWFQPHDMPNKEERARMIRELASVLETLFAGAAVNLVSRANHSAVQLVNLVVQHFPAFRDEAVYEGRQIFLYKRAQILVGDMWAAFGQLTSGDSPFAFYDIDKLTCFADYRIPQLFRAVKVFKYSDDLARAIDAHEVIPAGSDREVEIRACTVEAVERLQSLIATKRSAAGMAPLISVQIDWLLWQAGEKEKDTLLPHHRTLTVFY